MKTFVLLLCGMAVLAGLAEKYPRERYDVIVEKEIFGPPPPGFDPDVSPDQVVTKTAALEKELTKEQEQLKSAIHFSVINVEASGETVVGFTDNSNPKAPVHYYLKVGETQDEWTVKTADRESKSMTIAKGDIEVSLTLGGNSATGAGTTSRAGGAGAQPAAGDLAPSPRMLPSRSGLQNSSLRDRRLLWRQEKQAELDRQDRERAEKEAERQAQEAERQAQEKQQREAERAEQRQQLLAIQEELKRVREAKAAERNAAAEGSHAENDAQ